MIALVVSLLVTQPPPMPLELVSARPRPDMSAWFQRTRGWTGSDCAYSIRLGPMRTLWLFGDTWIGDIKDGRRVKPRMINNTAAWQELGDRSLRFFWNDSGAEPQSLVKPAAKDHWYWPGDGAMVDGVLYLIGHVIRRTEKGPPGFQFDWVSDDVLKIANPNDPPTAWKIESRPVARDLNLGVACCADGDFFYAYGLLTGPKKPLEAPVGVARIHRDRLAKLDMTGWEVWTGSAWQPGLSGAAALLRDGASEMSVQRVRGIDGFLAVYMPLGLSQDIAIRHARRPEGPWSAPLKVYRCPSETKDVYMYAAKGHAELSEKDGQLIVTYCRNIGALGEHIKRPEIYAPQVVEIQLKVK